MYTDVLDSTITISNILINDQAYYKDYADSICGFVFNAWPGLKYINGISIDLIKSLGTNYVTCLATNNKIEFDSATGYGITEVWNIPVNGEPNIYGEYANYIGYYSYNNQDKIVIYGFFDENGYLKNIRGSLSDPISLYVDSWNWIYEDVIINEQTGLPETIERVTQFPMISGCRIDALPIRNDCASGIVQKYFDFTDYHSQATLGDIPIVFLENGTWYWDAPGVVNRLIQ